jgi:hypothetical protein
MRTSLRPNAALPGRSGTGAWGQGPGGGVSAGHGVDQDTNGEPQGAGGVPRPRWQVVDAGGETVYLGRDPEAAYRVYGDLPRGRLFQARPPSVRSVAR